MSTELWLTLMILLGFSLFLSLAFNASQLIRRRELMFNIRYLENRLRATAAAARAK